MTESVSKRLDRIENKLDSLTDVLTTLAKIEEWKSHAGETHRVLFSKIEHHGVRIGAIDDRINAIENKQTLAAGKIGFAERMFWIIVAVLLGVAPRFF